MRRLKYENLDFCEYDVVRIFYGGNAGQGHLYAPSDMKFYQTWDAKNEFELDGHMYAQKNWIGVTKYSEEKEKISHTCHWNICGHKDDYPVININGVTVYNIGDKYLIWELKDIDIDINEKDFPICDELPKFDEPVYLLRTAKTEEHDILESLFENHLDISDFDFDRKLNRPFQYLKINGLSKNGESLDCVSVMVSSWCYHIESTVNLIEREDIDFLKCTLGGDHINKTCHSSKEEFETALKNTLNNILN